MQIFFYRVVSFQRPDRYYEANSPMTEADHYLVFREKFIAILEYSYVKENAFSFY